MRRIGVLILVAAAAAIVALLLLRHPSSPRAAHSSRGTGSHALATVPAGAPAWFTSQVGLPARRVAGRVEIDGHPVPRTPVRLTTSDTSLGDWTLVERLSDDGGRFDFGAIPAGAYHVRAEKPGRVAGDATVDLRKPDRADDLLVTLGPCAMRVHGTVRDVSGGVIARARIRAQQSGDRNLAHTVADDAGRYEICAPSGPVHVEAAADGYATVVEHATGVAEVRVDLDLKPELVVAGTVLAEDGAPAAGAEVSAESDGHLPGYVTESDESGRFRFEGLGAHAVTVVARSGELAAEKAIPGNVSGKTLEIVLQLQPTATLRGRVTEAGAPVAGATITVSPGKRGRHFGTAVSQPDGRFVLAGLPRRDVRVRVDEHKLVKPVTLDLSHPPDGEVELVCEHLAAVSGRVTQAGRPVAGAVLHIQTSRYLEEYSAADGTFRFAGVEPGTQVLTVGSWDPPGIAQSKTLEVGSRDIGDVVIELGPGASIAGEVVDEGGTPVADAGVFAWKAEGNDSGTTKTGADGRFLLPLLAGGGEYQISINGPGGSHSVPEQTKVVVPGAATKIEGIRIVVPGGHGTITGHVRRAGIAAAGVDVRAFGTGRTASAVTGPGGAFALTGLIDGTYGLFVSMGASTVAMRQGVAAGATDVEIDVPSTGSVEGRLVGFHDFASVSLVNGQLSALLSGVDDGFSIPDLVPGRYRVIAQAAEGETADATVTIEADKVARVTLTALGVAKVDGVVKTWPDGEPVADAMCHWAAEAPQTYGDSAYVIAPGQGGSLIRPDAAGRFTASVPAGKGRIRCGVRSGQSVEVRSNVIDLSGQSTAHVEIELYLARAPRSAVRQPLTDRIRAIDGLNVDGVSAEVIRMLLMQHEPGAPVPVVVERDGTEQTIEVTPEPLGQQRVAP